MRSRVVQPDGWSRPRGYSNGIVAAGRVAAIAGQIAWDPQGQLVSDGFVEQFEQALANVVTVVEAAGGSASDIASMTIFVTDIDEYRRLAPTLKEPWARVMRGHYPAMALVAVTALVEPRAKVEIAALAVLGEE